MCDFNATNFIFRNCFCQGAFTDTRQATNDMRKREKNYNASECRRFSRHRYTVKYSKQGAIKNCRSSRVALHPSRIGKLICSFRNYTLDQ